MVTIFALVAGVYFQQQSIEKLEDQIVSLESFEGRIASLEATSTWPMRFETGTRLPMEYSNLECFLQDMYDRVVENEDFGYACERDFQNNPLLNYMFMEAHSQIDGENDPMCYYSFDQILDQQAKSWGRMRSDDLYLTYDVIYDKVPD